MDRQNIAGLILAGGASSRMGRDKAFVQLGGRPLVAHAIGLLVPQVDALALSIFRGDPRFEPFGIKMLSDLGASREGPLAGLLSGLEWATDRAYTHMATIPVDSPFLPRDLVERLAEGRTDEIAVAVTQGRPHPVVALWPVTLRSALAGHLAKADQRRLTAFVEAHPHRLVPFADDQAFANINTPDELASAEAVRGSEAL